MIAKIIYTIIGVSVSVLIYFSLLSDVPESISIDITTQKPTIEMAQSDPNLVSDSEEDLKYLNANFTPEYDSENNLIPHSSGYSYVYDSSNNPVGLINGHYLENSLVNFDEDSDMDLYVYSESGKPVGHITNGEIEFRAADDSLPTMDNLYFVDAEDIKYYESVDLVNFGQENPMWHRINSVSEDDSGNTGNRPVGDVEYEDSDALDIAPYETIAFDTNIGDLVIVNVQHIESAIDTYGVLPVDSRYYAVTSPFGPRKDPFDGSDRFHTGLDIAETGIAGRFVYTVLTGEVVEMSNNGSLGNYIVVSHDSFNAVYAHLEAFAKDLKVGDNISAGDSIGYVGTTGRSTGHHLHLEFDIDGIKLNPERFMDIIRGEKSIEVPDVKDESID